MTETVHVSGTPEHGFIVDVHDGERHAIHSMHAASAEEAETEGLNRFQASAPVVAEPFVTASQVQAMIRAEMQAALEAAQKPEPRES